MGRKGGIGRLADLGDKAKRKRKTIGSAIGARGSSPADAFLARFQERVRAKQEQEQQQETARAAIGKRLQAGGAGKSLFGRLFGLGRG